jgi:ADP-heptose:LPS heptosyltransferase
MRIGVFRALRLGDMLCSIPAVSAIRRGYPDAEIILIGLPWSGALVARYRNYFDGHLEFTGYPGLSEHPCDSRRIPAFLQSVQALRLDFAIQMHGSGRITNPLVSLFGAASSAGFYIPGDYCPDPEKYLPYPNRGHEIERCLRLAEAVGGASCGTRLEFPVFDEDSAGLKLVAEVGNLSAGHYACIHPGKRDERKRWPAANFAEVADELAAQGLRIVITGSVEEADLAETVRRQMRSHAINAAKLNLGLGTLAALISKAALLVANDTGVVHLANALAVPSVSIFADPHLERWAAEDRTRHRALYSDSGVSVAWAIAEVKAAVAQGGGACAA